MLYALDTETNGREPVPEVIELAYLPISLPHFDSRCAETCERFCPTLGSTWGALAIHHILDEELAGLPESKTARIPKDATYILGHNVDYDWKALGSPAQVKRICSLAIARALYPEVDSHSLSAMFYRMAGVKKLAREQLKDAHTALADMINMLAVLKAMLADKGYEFDDVEDFWRFSEECRIPKIMTFGKFKGTAIRDIPEDYKRWCYRQPDFDPYVIRAMKGGK